MGRKVCGEESGPPAAPARSEVKPTSPAAVAQRLRRSYFNFRWPLFLLDGEEAGRPCLANGWTMLAMAAHVAWWDSFQLRRMQAALDGGGRRRISWTGESNDERAERETRAWEAVLEEADEARRALIEFALSLTEEQICAEYLENGERRQVLLQVLTRMPEHVDEHAVDVHRYCFSLGRWGRDGALAFYGEQFKDLLDSITGLMESCCLSVPVCGAWSVRDVLAHTLVWDEYAWALIGSWPDIDLAKVAPWMEQQVDATNERLMAQKSDLSMIDLLDGLATVHRRIVRKFSSLSDDRLQAEASINGNERGNAVYLLISMAAHMADHAAQIYAARAEGRLVPMREEAA